MNGFLNLPDLPFRTAAIGGRIHNDSVIVIPAPDFPLHELDTVVHDPADRRRFETGGPGIFLGPAHHALGGVHMGDRGAGGCGCQCGSARVGKQV